MSPTALSTDPGGDGGDMWPPAFEKHKVEFGLTVCQLLEAEGILTLFICRNGPELPFDYEPCKRHQVM